MRPGVGAGYSPLLQQLQYTTGKSYVNRLAGSWSHPWVRLFGGCLRRILGLRTLWHSSRLRRRPVVSPSRSNASGRSSSLAHSKSVRPRPALLSPQMISLTRSWGGMLLAGSSRRGGFKGENRAPSIPQGWYGSSAKSVKSTGSEWPSPRLSTRQSSCRHFGRTKVQPLTPRSCSDWCRCCRFPRHWPPPEKPDAQAGC